MKKFEMFRSVIAPLPMKDVDTDLIIPAQFLTSTSRGGYGENLFQRLRQSPDFVLNRPEYEGAEILLVGENFGCGSSREHAVWALQGAGFKVIIGTDFADIFAGNSAKNGLLLISLPSVEVAELFGATEGKNVEAVVDLEAQRVVVDGGKEYSFSYDPFRKTCLLNGFDDLDYLQSHRREIETYFSKTEQV